MEPRKKNRMKPTAKILILLIFVTTGIILGRLIRRAPTSPQRDTANATTQSSYETQENEGGSVTVSVTPLTLKPNLPASFDITFETHSIDLTFDVERVATLTDRTGTPYKPIWEGSPPGGHHRSGTLRFTPDLERETTVTLTLKDIAGIATRIFSWEMKK